VLEVGVINVSVDPEKTFEYDFNDVYEVSREGDSQLAWKHLLVV